MDCRLHGRQLLNASSHRHITADHGSRIHCDTCEEVGSEERRFVGKSSRVSLYACCANDVVSFAPLAVLAMKQMLMLKRSKTGMKFALGLSARIKCVLILLLSLFCRFPRGKYLNAHVTSTLGSPSVDVK